MTHRFKFLLGFWFLTLGSSFAQQNVTSISNLTISPSTPSPGQTIAVSWSYNIPNAAGTTPDAIIAISNTSTLQSAGAANQWVVLGDSCAPEAGNVNGGCYVGPAVSGNNNYSTTVTIPAGLTPGVTYYVIVAMRGAGGAYMNPTVTVDYQTSIPFTVPLPAPYITLNKVAQGSTANPGGEVLFIINYSASNIHNAQITDAVDPNFTITQIFNGGTALGQNITWNLPAYIGSPTTSFVSFLATVSGSATAGQVFDNVANATSTEVNATSNMAQVAISQPELTVLKSAPASVAAATPVTYVINYTNFGLALEEFENFDNGVIPPAWTSTGCAWSAAPGYLQETQSCLTCTTYPYLQDSSMAPILYGVYVVDMMVDSGDCNNFDSVFNFNITVSGGVTTVYQARLSGQKGSNNASSNVLAYDIGGSNVAFASPPNMGNVQEGTPANPAWYTVKVQVCSGQVLMKAWPKGTLEPGAWDINYSGPQVPTIAGWAGFQANRGPVDFDNLMIFNTSGVAAPVITDNVPSNVTYQGCTGGCSQSAGTITWNVGSTCGSANSVTWWGLVGACGSGPITNQAVINSSSIAAPVTSNSVITSISGCVVDTPTFTNTLTPTNSPTVTNTPTPTNSPTFTDTPTPTNTPTITNTGTPTLTFTNTLTPTITFTPTFTPTAAAVNLYDSASPNMAEPGDLITYNVAMSAVTAGALNGQVWTIVLPSNVTFLSFVTNVGETYNSATRTITWNTASGVVTAGFTSGFSYQVRIDPNAPGGSVQSDLFTLTYTNQTAPQTISAPVTVIAHEDIFYVDKNLFSPSSDGAVSITVGYSRFPGNYSLKIYNSAGEYIRNLADRKMNGPINDVQTWDGKNNNGDVCASGMYILYLIEPFDRKVKRLLLVR